MFIASRIRFGDEICWEAEKIASSAFTLEAGAITCRGRSDVVPSRLKTCPY